MIEVLVAISVLLIAIVGPMTIASKGLQSAQLAREENTATFLAQEGIEIVLNKRNAQVLEYLQNATPVTEAALWDWTTDVDCDPDSNATGCSVAIGAGGDSAITDCGSKEACRLYLGTSGRMVYSTDTSDTRTPFVRQVFIDPQGSDQVEVRSVVSWDSNIADSERSVELLTVITDTFSP